LGALLISLTDLPDNRLNKLKTALWSIIVFFATTLVVSSVLDHVYLAAVVVVLAAFSFSMFAVYGQKLSLIGTMALIVCTFVMGLHPARPLYFSSYILLGGRLVLCNQFDPDFVAALPLASSCHFRMPDEQRSILECKGQKLRCGYPARSATKGSHKAAQ
jgi:hypothetical protein